MEDPAKNSCIYDSYLCTPHMKPLASLSLSGIKRFVSLVTIAMIFQHAVPTQGASVIWQCSLFGLVSELFCHRRGWIL